ncbi:hypothetical protein ACHAWU_009290 [Discostella pseudostelligera]|uniref:Uncharacterized protein n=1 Tax=Discostella pseudostelligera TaxID=259834 RepID=A0ABD3M287_9STRA
MNNMPVGDIQTNKISKSMGKYKVHSTPPSLPSHAHQIMEAFLWNNKKAPRHEQNKHREIQSQILSNIHRATPLSDQQQEEVQPLVPMHSHLSPICEIRSAKKCCNQKYDPQNSINHHYHHVTWRQQHKQRTNDQYDDIEEDIVCCDGGRCHEGSKNLCTVALWIVFAFFIIDRIISHVPMHFHKPQSVTPNDVTMVDAGNRNGHLESPSLLVTPHFTNSSVGVGV